MIHHFKYLADGPGKHAGIAQENVIRLLKEFKEEGILETDGRKICITDIKRLVKKSNYR
jgi:hypothetical protein